MIETILAVAGGLVAGLVVALRVIAPMTGNKTDDAVLAALEKALPYLPHEEKAAAKAVLADARMVRPVK